MAVDVRFLLKSRGGGTPSKPLENKEKLLARLQGALVYYQEGGVGKFGPGFYTPPLATCKKFSLLPALRYWGW